MLTGINLTFSTSPACQGYSLTSVFCPPTILAARWARPHLQSPETAATEERLQLGNNKEINIV